MSRIGWIAVALLALSATGLSAQQRPTQSQPQPQPGFQTKASVDAKIAEARKQFEAKRASVAAAFQLAEQKRLAAENAKVQAAFALLQQKVRSP